jgi:broad specificity phosphatase PhoE
VRVYVITHVATAQDPSLSPENWALSPLGEEQARRLADAPFWTEVTQVIVSAEQKSYLSVSQIVAARKLPVWVDSRLDELRRDGWVGDYRKQVAMVLGQPAKAVGEWEPAAQTQARALAALSAIHRRFAPGPVAIVGHGLSLSLVRARFLGYETVRFDEWSRLSFGAVACLDLKQRRWLEDFPLASSLIR